ncbi:MAG: glycosyltransferase [Gammaproteobacteria bacterium]|nr:glycosyltransferase [Gammaproteobacteria bacterium]MDE2252085.1 glycosyltransferase [Gammaproteobacteria bacterium]
MEITVCIATYRRSDRLALLLDDLARQSLRPDEVVVVDNDATGSARAVVEAMRPQAPYALRYAIQPERNIARTRNLTVALAGGDWLAFIDDDERARPRWLASLVAAAREFNADCVLAPVEPQVPEHAPAWIRGGHFYDFPHLPEGAIVPLNRMRFGNVLLAGARLRAEPGPFDVRYGLMTGEDADLLIRMAAKGARIVWTETAPVYEPIEDTRLSLHWLLQRALSGGQEFARKTLDGKYGPVSRAQRFRLFARALAQMALAALLALLCLPSGRRRVAQWLVRAAANLGKLSVFWGWRYHEYA